MSDEENHRKWERFVEIGNNIHLMRGEYRTLEAMRSLVLAKHLVKSEFIASLSYNDEQVYNTLLPKIAEYLDGNAQVIQEVVTKHFFAQHCKSGLGERLFNISFAPKKVGIQTGFICDVYNGVQTVRYYIKTHQHGPTESNLKSTKPPDAKELFVYRLLEHIGMGPEAHFIVPFHGTKKTIYIATKDCHFVLLSKLTSATAKNEALLQLDLISRILCLRDCATNPLNCGQVGEKAMIVDFCIETQSLGYVKANILEKFYVGNSEFNYIGLMGMAVKTPNDIKKDIMKKSLQEWKLLESIERAQLDIERFLEEIVGEMVIENDLQQYVRDIKATVEILMKA